MPDLTSTAVPADEPPSPSAQPRATREGESVGLGTVIMALAAFSMALFGYLWN